MEGESLIQGGKMKKYLALLVSSFMLWSQLATAQANNFEGLSVSAGLGMVGAQTTYEERPASPPLNNISYGKTVVTESVEASLSKALNARWLIGAGFMYGLQSIETALNETIDTAGALFRFSIKAKHHWSLYLQPSYTLDESTAVFAKIGYHSVDMHIRDTNGQVISTPNFHSSLKLSGVGYHLGIKKFIRTPLFLQLEAQYVPFHASRSTSANQYNGRSYYEVDTSFAAGIISLGYRF
jgi:hypothetical protein